MGKLSFDDWITSLEEDVVQDEYGYERGEFTVYPDIWRGLYDEGLTPSAAFKRALDAYGDARREEEVDHARRWERIQAEDRPLLSATPGDGDEPQGDVHDR